MACSRTHFSNGSAETDIIMIELRKVFDKCAINGSEEVEVEPLINQLCTVLPAMDTQEKLKENLFDLLFSAGSTTVTRQKYEMCMLDWIGIVFERNINSCSDQYDSLQSNPQGIVTSHMFTSTPIRGSANNFENFNGISTGEIQFDNETSKDSFFNSQLQHKEEMESLKQKNTKLERAYNDLKTQLSGLENSPCIKCMELKSKIERLQKNHKELLKTHNRNCEELTEELAKSKEEIKQLRCETILEKKKNESLQIVIDELQTQVSHLIDHLNKEEKKGEDYRKVITKLEEENLKNMKYIEHVEINLQSASDENEMLREKVRNIEEMERISSYRNSLHVLFEEEEEESSSSLFASVPVENNLLQELNDEGTYRFAEASVQTSVIVSASVGVQFSPCVEKKSVQTSTPVSSRQIHVVLPLNVKGSQTEFSAISQATQTQFLEGCETDLSVTSQATQTQFLERCESDLSVTSQGTQTQFLEGCETDLSVTSQESQTQLSVTIEESQSQRSVTTQESQTQFTEGCETQLTFNNSDELEPITNIIVQQLLQETLVQQRKTRKFGWINVCYCVIIVPLVTAAVLYSSSESELLQDILTSIFNPMFVFAKQPPV